MEFVRSSLVKPENDVHNVQDVHGASDSKGSEHERPLNVADSNGPTFREPSPVACGPSQADEHKESVDNVPFDRSFPVELSYDWLEEQPEYIPPWDCAETIEEEQPEFIPPWEIAETVETED